MNLEQISLEEAQNLIKDNEQKKDLTAALTTFVLESIENNLKSMDSKSVCKFKSDLLDCENLEDFVSFLEDSVNRTMDELEEYIVYEKIKDEKERENDYGL